MAILLGLAIAAALILLPQALAFKPAAEDACVDRGAAYVGLDNEPGRYGDPVPEGASCLPEGESAPVDIAVNFFAGAEAVDVTLSWAYRLACLLAPIGIAVVVGSRLSRQG